jgi:hypothetical protein
MSRLPRLLLGEDPGDPTCGAPAGSAAAAATAAPTSPTAGSCLFSLSSTLSSATSAPAPPPSCGGSSWRGGGASRAGPAGASLIPAEGSAPCAGMSAVVEEVDDVDARRVFESFRLNCGNGSELGLPTFPYGDVDEDVRRCWSFRSGVFPPSWGGLPTRARGWSISPAQDNAEERDHVPAAGQREGRGGW